VVTKSSRPDAVTALLGQIWDDALDPGYAAAAGQRSAVGSARRWHGRSVRVGTVAGLLLIGALFAVALAQTRATAPAVAKGLADLQSRIREQTAAYDATTAQVTALQAAVARIKGTELSSTSQGEVLNRQLTTLGLQAGQVAVSGPGVQVTMDDAAVPPPGTDPSVDRVLDRDLQSVVNGLWLAGAEAVAVNGQRLTALSAIRSAGDAILVDYRPLNRPYVVTAIADPGTVAAAFSSGPAGQALRVLQHSYGIRFSIRTVQQLGLPAASAVQLRYARAKEVVP
jgi:uncharacterized protein YlxW (UPF0749 family)